MSWEVELTYGYEFTLYHDRQMIDCVYVTLGGLAYSARVGEWVCVTSAKLLRLTSMVGRTW